MLTIKQITDDKEGVIKGLEKKHFAGAREAIDAVLRQNDLRRETQGKLDTLLQAMNAKSKEIGALMREGKREEAEAAKAEVAAKKEESKKLDGIMSAAADEMKRILLTIPNVPYQEVPEGKDSNDNVVEKMGANSGKSTIFGCRVFVPAPYLISILPATCGNIKACFGAPPMTPRNKAICAGKPPTIVD